MSCTRCRLPLGVRASREFPILARRPGAGLRAAVDVRGGRVCLVGDMAHVAVKLLI